MDTFEKIERIDELLSNWFDEHPTEKGLIPALDFMDLFVKAGVFNKDYDRKGNPIRKLLRELGEKDSLYLIPYVWADRKSKYVSWYFRYVDLAHCEEIINSGHNHC